jgi:hypothetical protein
MQIRSTTQKLLCIRTIYDQSIGRGKATTIASFKRFYDSSEIHKAEGFDILTTGEQQQLIDYLLAEEKAIESRRHTYASRHLISHLSDAIASINSGVEVSEEDAIKLYTRIDTYQKLLKKQGFKKGELLKKESFKLTMEQDGL